MRQRPMKPERRYTEEEIAAIFQQAAEAQEAAQQGQPTRDGLTLAELQQIGHEAGLTPAFVAQAAATMDRPVSAPPPTTWLGVPVGVARAADLPGPLSDEGWDRLVVDLRETFQARGKVQREGSLREWRNGNLYAVAEPTADDGHRLRLGTRKGNAASMIGIGLTFFAVSLVFLVMMLGGEFVWDKVIISVLFAVGGLGTAGGTAFRLSRWAGTRTQQMEAVLARTADRMTDPSEAASLDAPAAAPPLDLDEQPDRAETTFDRQRLSNQT